VSDEDRGSCNELYLAPTNWAVALTRFGGYVASSFSRACSGGKSGGKYGAFGGLEGTAILFD
jgi:hypothetical protein